MLNILAITDVVLDPVTREVSEISNGSLHLTGNYSEDIISTLLSLPEQDLVKYDALFIHSDQVFHQKEVEWQKLYLNTLEKFSSKFRKTILLSNAFSLSYMGVPMKESFGNNYAVDSIYSDEFKKLLQRDTVYVFDFEMVCSQLGTLNVYNYNLGHLYQMPYTKPAVKLFAQKLTEQINWLFAEEKKAIIVDCDNTLWKGIVGEDGIDGIVCDKNSDGIIHYNLQQFLKAKREEGFLLCLCSKNNEADVKEAFAKKSFPLKWENFVCRKINWNDKIQNIKEIAKDLNINTDSFIFIDDNLFELNSVAGLLKGVTCMHIGNNYADLLNITGSLAFRRRRLLEADKEKSKQYEVENLRKEEGAKYADLEDFIKSLEIKTDIRLNDINDLERLSQMTGKTNQLNFNKRAWSVDELKTFIAQSNRLYSLKVSDKYGDYGTVGIIMVELQGKEATIENYLMSCRALGKGIEDTFYEDIMGKLAKENITVKEIKFVKTEKNIPAQEFIAVHSIKK